MTDREKALQQIKKLANEHGISPARIANELGDPKFRAYVREVQARLLPEGTMLIRETIKEEMLEYQEDSSWFHSRYKLKT